jgi:hypothetical protein
MRKQLFCFIFCFEFMDLRAVLSFEGTDSVDAGILARRLASSGFNLIGDRYYFIWLSVKIVAR